MSAFNLRDQAFLGSLTAPVGPYTPTTVPTDFASNVRWYKASDLIGEAYANTDPVDVNWLDNSVVGDDAVPNATDPPTWDTGEIVSPGSEGCVRITSTAGNERFDFTELTMSDFSILFLWRPTTGQDTFCMGSSSGNYQVRNKAPLGSPQSFPSLFPAGAPAMEVNTVGAEDPTIWHVQAWTRNAGTATFYHNKVARTAAVNSNTPDMKVDAVGMPIAAQANFWVADVQIYTTALSQANIDDLFDNYFSKKYADDL